MEPHYWWEETERNQLCSLYFTVAVKRGVLIMICFPKVLVWDLILCRGVVKGFDVNQIDMQINSGRVFSALTMETVSAKASCVSWSVAVKLMWLSWRSKKLLYSDAQTATWTKWLLLSLLMANGKKVWRRNIRLSSVYLQSWSITDGPWFTTSSYSALWWRRHLP